MRSLVFEGSTWEEYETLREKKSILPILNLKP